MLLNEVKPGIEVTIIRLNGTTGMFIHPNDLARRKVGMTGIVIGPVAGHGGDVWWVRQGDKYAPYTFEEMQKTKGV